jgi:ATP-dependent DNA helicase DinG
MTQADLPKPALLEAFAADETSCLFATAGFFQGVDVPGPALSLVVLDRLPFPRPDDPLQQARREASSNGFGAVDLPHAATQLAQAAGRLIRSRTDSGVVAILDRRLATARSYRWELIRALPPFQRTGDPEVALERLRAIRAGREAASAREAWR